MGLEYWITMAISILLMAIKDPIMKAKFRDAFLKVGRAIDMAFPGEICKPQVK